MKYVVEVDPSDFYAVEAVAGKLKPLAAYTAQLANENTQLHEQIGVYKDFVRDLCIESGLSLQSSLMDITRRVSKDHAGLKALMTDFQQAIAPGKNYNLAMLVHMAKEHRIGANRRRTLENHVTDFTEQLHEDAFIKLAPED